MAQLTAIEFVNKWALRFATNTSGNIKEADFREFSQDIADSFLSPDVQPATTTQTGVVMLADIQSGNLVLSDGRVITGQVLNLVLESIRTRLNQKENVGIAQALINSLIGGADSSSNTLKKLSDKINGITRIDRKALTIEERNTYPSSATPPLQDQENVYVADATGDTSVEEGAAIYKWIATIQDWIKISEPGAIDFALTALATSFDPTGTGLEAGNVQAAIVELKALIDGFTQYTDEQARDAVGGALSPQFQYLDNTNIIDLADVVTAQTFDTTTHDFILDFSAKGRLIAWTKTPKGQTPNQPPVVDAGADKSLAAGTTSASLSATASDPDGAITVRQWTQLSGPNTATIVTPSANTTNVTGLIAGNYVFQFTATDNDTASASDTVQVIVGVANISPVVNAGNDQTLPAGTTSANLTGTASDSDGTIASRTWTQFAGPSATITTPNANNTTVTGLVHGVYIFRFTATDNNAAMSYDDIQITVQRVFDNSFDSSFN